MAKSSNNSTTSSSSQRRAPKDAQKTRGKRPSPFGKEEWIDYKDINLLRRFMSDRGKIRARRVTGADSQKQRELARAIKTARELALLPYSQRTTTERAGRGNRNDRDRRSDEGNNEGSAGETRMDSGAEENNNDEERGE